MAENTDISLRNQVMYSIYVRNHTPEGTFKAVEKDLKRIKDLGTDVIWFMPVHPIGVKSKKGSLGCPYAIRNYRDVNPEYGTIEDFKHLVNEIHNLGMKCIIDVVYNHTSPDSWLVENHREYFYKKSDGNLGNQVGDWTDIVDLDYNNKELWDYQIETLKMWAEIVDGFRCDVASLVPVEFWKKARREVEKIRPDSIWLAESVDADFIQYLRSCGVLAQSDSKVYEAFDICYPYDIWNIFEGYYEGNNTLKELVDSVNYQECCFEDNYVKIRCIENHDRARIMSRVDSIDELYNITALSYFQKGMAFLYAGQEFANVNTPSLFEYDRINRDTGTDISDFLKKLADIKKNEVFAKGYYKGYADEENQIITAKYCMGDIGNCDNIKAYGIFAMKGSKAYKEDGIYTKCELKDGEYTNCINDKIVIVKDGKVQAGKEPVIILI